MEAEVGAEPVYHSRFRHGGSYEISIAQQAIIYGDRLASLPNLMYLFDGMDCAILQERTIATMLVVSKAQLRLRLG